MAKKVTKKLEARLYKTKAKAGAWLCTVEVFDVMADGELALDHGITSAWTNASAGKREIKARVLEYTPKKSIKMIAGEELDEKGKPVGFEGNLTYKIEIDKQSSLNI
jgi:hypothetical protein